MLSAHHVKRSGRDRFLHAVRIWRYDHSEELLAFRIGAIVVVATVGGIVAFKLLT